MRPYLAEITYVDGTIDAFAYDKRESSSLSVTFHNIMPVVDRASMNKGPKYIVSVSQIRKLSLFTPDAPTPSDAEEGE